MNGNHAAPASRRLDPLALAHAGPARAVPPDPAALRVPGTRRIAVLRANALGDFVVALPAITALKAAYPRARITLLGQRWHAELMDGRPGPVDRVVAVREPSGLVDPADRRTPEARAFRRRMRAKRFDIAVQLHGGGQTSNAVVRKLGARVTAGCRAPGAKPLDRTIAYTLYQPEVTRFLEVVALVGAEPVGLEPRLAVTDSDVAAAWFAWPACSYRPYAVIHPGASDARRCWPAERYAEVARHLTLRGLQPVVVGTRPEAPRTAVAAAVGAVDLTGRLSLPALVGLLAGARLAVGNDSGPMHLAGAAGTPTVRVYWCGNLINAGPLYRDRQRALVAWRTACPVCGQPNVYQRCPHEVSFVADVPTGAVLDEVDALLDATTAVTAHGVAPDAAERRRQRRA